MLGGCLVCWDLSGTRDGPPYGTRNGSAAIERVTDTTARAPVSNRQGLGLPGYGSRRRGGRERERERGRERERERERQHLHVGGQRRRVGGAPTPGPNLGEGRLGPGPSAPPPHSMSPSQRERVKKRGRGAGGGGERETRTELRMSGTERKRLPPWAHREGLAGGCTALRELVAVGLREGAR